MLYTATGQLINSDNSTQTTTRSTPKKIEYKANGNLIIEENNKETVQSAQNIPTDQVYHPFSVKSTEEE
jgi:hypothetical protein